MIASILRAHAGQDALSTQGNLNNDIGVPQTLLRLRAHHRSAVVELGMNHPGEIATLAAIAQPTVALVNNAQREHLEFMHTVQAVAEENGSVLAALPADGRLPGRFDADWKPTVKWSCLTGDCQLGINWGRMFQITGDARYRDATTRILGFVKKTQQLASSEPAVIGGIKGSHPINGGYHPWQYPNWATKFYADALMMDMANRSGRPYGLTGASGTP